MCFEPDLDYVIDLIAFAYDSVAQALDQDDLQTLELEAAHIGGVLHNHLTEK